MAKRKAKLSELILEWLKMMRWEEVTSTSSKYRKFRKQNVKTFVWLGRCGAVRIGRTVTNSHSRTDMFKKHDLIVSLSRAGIVDEDGRWV
jgi:hypothetical protein